jgi:hypothetical protein
MAVKQTPPPGYLGYFRNPLWRAAGLTETRAESIVEGTRGGYAFTVLELRHRSMKLTDEHGYDITTVFILKLGRASDTWQNNLSSSNGSSIWLDNDTLYLARIGVDTPVADWNDLLAEAIRAAGYATDVPSATPTPAPRIRAKSHEQIVLFWVVVAGLLPGLEWLFGLYMIAAGSLGAIAHSCFEVFPGHNQLLFGLALCLPMIGHFLALKIMYDYYGRPGFTWRILLNMVLIGILTCAGFAMAMEWTKSRPGAVAARALRCR